jgi:hypothetical protein
MTIRANAHKWSECEHCNDSSPMSGTSSSNRSGDLARGATLLRSLQL